MASFALCCGVFKLYGFYNDFGLIVSADTCFVVSRRTRSRDRRRLPGLRQRDLLAGRGVSLALGLACCFATCPDITFQWSCLSFCCLSFCLSLSLSLSLNLYVSLSLSLCVSLSLCLCVSFFVCSSVCALWDFGCVLWRARSSFECGVMRVLGRVGDDTSLCVSPALVVVSPGT